MENCNLSAIDFAEMECGLLAIDLTKSTGRAKIMEADSEGEPIDSAKIKTVGASSSESEGESTGSTNIKMVEVSDSDSTGSAGIKILEAFSTESSEGESIDSANSKMASPRESSEGESMKVDNRPRNERKPYEWTDSELRSVIGPWDDLPYIPKDKEAFDKLRKYLKQCEESEGFDIDLDVYEGSILGLTSMAPARVSRELYPEKYEIFEDVAKFAIEAYNFNQNTDFEVAEVEKVTTNISNYIVYNITFTAIDVEKSCKTFQAKVSEYAVHPEKPKTLMFCRIRPDS